MRWRSFADVYVAAATGAVPLGIYWAAKTGWPLWAVALSALLTALVQALPGLLVGAVVLVAMRGRAGTPWPARGLAAATGLMMLGAILYADGRLA